MQIRVHITSAILAATLGAVFLLSTPVYAQLEGGTTLNEKSEPIREYTGDMVYTTQQSVGSSGTLCPKMQFGDANCNNIVGFLEQPTSNALMGSIAYISAANYIVSANSSISTFTDNTSVALKDIFTNVLTYRAASPDVTKTLLDQLSNIHPSWSSSLDNATIYNAVVALSNTNTSGTGVPLTDYDIWQKEYSGELHTKNADFNGDGVVNLTDYEIWRTNAITTAVCTPPATGQIACVNAGGSWMQFPNGCADSCGSSGKICTQALTMACECGANMCWDGSKCISGGSGGDGSGLPVEVPEKLPATVTSSSSLGGVAPINACDWSLYHNGFIADKIGKLCDNLQPIDVVRVYDGTGGTVYIPKDMITPGSPTYDPVAANDYRHFMAPGGESTIYQDPKKANEIIATRIECESDTNCTITKYTNDGVASEQNGIVKSALSPDLQSQITNNQSQYIQGNIDTKTYTAPKAGDPAPEDRVWRTSPNGVEYFGTLADNPDVPTSSTDGETEQSINASGDDTIVIANQASVELADGTTISSEPVDVTVITKGAVTDTTVTDSVGNDVTVAANSGDPHIVEGDLSPTEQHLDVPATAPDKPYNSDGTKNDLPPTDPATDPARLEDPSHKFIDVPVNPIPVQAKEITNGKVAGVQTSVSDPFEGLLLSPQDMRAAIIRGTPQEGMVAGVQTQIPYPYDAIMDSELLSPHDMKTVIITGNYLPNL